MNIYCVDGATTNLRFGMNQANAVNHRVSILVSYHYYKNVDMEALIAGVTPRPNVFADSGGFSAYTQGVEINLTDYVEWLKRWKDVITFYANLDVIGDPVATLANQQTMESLGLNPLPVFHTGEPWHYLEEYIKRYEYIALGGMVPYSSNTQVLGSWLVECFKRAKPNTGYHGFGCTSWELVRNFPWRSVDSSSWGAIFRYGRMAIFDKSSGRWATTSTNIHDKAEVYKHARALRNMGFDPAEFFKDEPPSRALLCAISIRSYLDAEDWVNELWGRETKVFLADIPRNDVISGWKYLEGENGISNSSR